VVFFSGFGMEEYDDESVSGTEISGEENSTSLN
jgi:hypothetical protein